MEVHCDDPFHQETKNNVSVAIRAKGAEASTNPTAEGARLRTTQPTATASPDPSSEAYRQLLESALEGGSGAAVRAASPAWSTNSFLTVVSNRAASARGLSMELWERASSAQRLPSPQSNTAIIKRTTADALGAAMEAVVPDLSVCSSPPQPIAAAALLAPVSAAGAASSSLFRDTVRTFGQRDLDAREQLLHEVQRQRVAAEAALMKMQLRSSSSNNVFPLTSSHVSVPTSSTRRLSPEPQPTTSAPLLPHFDRAPQNVFRQGKSRSEERSQSRPSTLKDLFAIAASGVPHARVGLSESRATPSSSRAQQERGASLGRMSQLEQLAAGGASPTVVTSHVKEHATASSSSAGNTRSSSSSGGTLRNWSVSSPSAATTPTHAPEDEGPLSPLVYRCCSSLRPLTRSLLSTLIRLDVKNNGSVTVPNCLEALQTVLCKSSISPVDAANVRRFLQEILSRVEHANGNTMRLHSEDLDKEGLTVPYAALVSTIVEIASEGSSPPPPPSAGSGRATSQRQGSLHGFNFGSPTFPSFV
jgi:hypothetical protein